VVRKGTTAPVYEAWRPALERVVALKVPAPALTADAEFVARFRREAVIARGLDHPHIVPVYDVGEDAIGRAVEPIYRSLSDLSCG
jgi:serine/threonine-protein kinase